MAWIEMGLALKRIREKKLFKLRGYKTWEAYLRGRFPEKNFPGRRYAYQLIASAKVAEKVNLGARVAITNERHARALLAAPEGQRAEVWQRASQAGEPSTEYVEMLAKKAADSLPPEQLTRAEEETREIRREEEKVKEEVAKIDINEEKVKLLGWIAKTIGKANRLGYKNCQDCLEEALQWAEEGG